jgi:hypothetical protein
MAKLKGIEQINKNLRKVLKSKEQDLTNSMMRAGMMIEGESNKLVPVDTGTLRATSYTQRIDKNSIQVGYTALYAPAVHESPMKLKGVPRSSGSGKGSYWDVGENKFLRKAFDRNVAKLTRIVVNGIKV